MQLFIFVCFQDRTMENKTSYLHNTLKNMLSFSIKLFHIARNKVFKINQFYISIEVILLHQ